MVSCWLARTAEWQASVASNSLRRSVSARVAPNSRSSCSTSRAAFSACECLSMAGIARTPSVVGDSGAMSKPSWCSVSRCSSAVAISSVSALKVDRDQQLLRRHLLRVQRGLEFFIHDALVRSMHVDDDQAMLVLGQDVDAGELGEGEA